ncbi:MAG TPA: tetratricopeptide repeat protein [Terriglobia bacterium]|nr:tetratricopeptide repeat protein [Terriglobia bacterium]
MRFEINGPQRHPVSKLRRPIGLASLAGAVLLGATLAGAQTKEPSKPSAPPANSEQFERVVKEATAAREANNSVQAIALYHKAVRLSPRWAEGWWYLGTLYYDSDHYPEGAKAFHNLVEVSPHYGAAWALLGLCEFEMKDYKNSFIHLQRGRVEGLGDNHDLIHVTRYHQALVEILNGGFEDANSLLSSLVTENVLSNDVKLALGLALLHVPLLPNQIDPSKDSLVSAAGNIGELEALNDFDEAKKAFERLIHDYPTTPFVHYSYGAMLAELSQYKESEQQLLEEIKINPDSSMPYMQIAYVYIRENQFDDALPVARKAVQLVPESFAAHYLLGRTLLGLGQVNDSIRELTIAKRLGPYSPEVRYNLARALARAKRTREAAQEQAEFERLDALVQRAQQKSQPQSYRESGERGDVAPRQGQAPSAAGPPQ